MRFLKDREICRATLLDDLGRRGQRVSVTFETQKSFQVISPTVAFKCLKLAFKIPDYLGHSKAHTAFSFVLSCSLQFALVYRKSKKVLYKWLLVIISYCTKGSSLLG